MEPPRILGWRASHSEREKVLNEKWACLAGPALQSDEYKSKPGTQEEEDTSGHSELLHDRELPLPTSQLKFYYFAVVTLGLLITSYLSEISTCNT